MSSEPPDVGPANPYRPPTGHTNEARSSRRARAGPPAPASSTPATGPSRPCATATGRRGPERRGPRPGRRGDGGRPLGSALAAGIGWVIDHLNPIKGWFRRSRATRAAPSPRRSRGGYHCRPRSGGHRLGQHLHAPRGRKRDPRSAPTSSGRRPTPRPSPRSGGDQGDAAGDLRRGRHRGVRTRLPARRPRRARRRSHQLDRPGGAVLRHAHSLICGQIGTRVAAADRRVLLVRRRPRPLGGAARRAAQGARDLGPQLLRLLDKIKTNPSLHRPTPGTPRPDGPPRTHIPPWTWTPRTSTTRAAGTRRPTGFPDAMGDGVRGGVRAIPNRGYERHGRREEPTRGWARGNASRSVGSSGAHGSDRHQDRDERERVPARPRRRGPHGPPGDEPARRARLRLGERNQAKNRESRGHRSDLLRRARASTSRPPQTRDDPTAVRDGKEQPAPHRRSPTRGADETITGLGRAVRCRRHSCPADPAALPSCRRTGATRATPGPTAGGGLG